MQARQDVANAENEVAEISRAHLATLLATPPRERLSRLADPELTPADKTALENSVRSLLPRSTAAKLLTLNLAGTLRRLLQRCGYKCMASIVVLAVCGLPAGTAWRNTGKRVIVSTETWLVDWHLPGWLNSAWRVESRLPGDRYASAARISDPSLLAGRPGLRQTPRSTRIGL